MGTGRLNGVVHQVRETLAATFEGVGDRQLLQRFVADHDPDAFESLLRRHGPMVLGVCRRVLGHTPDAEDAFQAAFLVLARKAGSVRRQDALGHWLYGVACRTARKARSARARRQSRERQVREMPHPPTSDEGHDDDWLRLLDEELARLPERYRSAVVLCDLQGLGRRLAAEQLGCREGTLSSRLARGRALLRERLARRGITPMAAAGALLAARPDVPAGLIHPTVKAAVAFSAGSAAPVIQSPVLTLTEGVLKAMFVARLRIPLLVLLTAAVGAGLSQPVRPTRAAEPPADRPHPHATSDPDAATRAEAARFRGLWVMSDYRFGDLRIAPQALRSCKVTLRFDPGNVLTARASDSPTGQELEVRGTYRLYPDRAPPAVDFTLTPPGQTRRVTLHGVYEIDGDTVRAAFAVPGDGRPPDLGARPGAIHVTLRRGAQPAVASSTGPTDQPAAKSGVDAEVDRLKREIRELRAELQRLHPQAPPAAVVPGAPCEHFMRLLERELERDHGDEQVAETLYLATLARWPTAEEKRIAAVALSVPSTRKEGFTNLLWMLTHSEEFLADVQARARCVNRRLDP